MNSFMLQLILKTIPKIDANQYEDGKIILKPKKAWKNDIFNFLIGFIASAICFFVLFRIPYVGVLFFIAGFLGMIMTLMFAIRALIIYKNYDDIFSKENIEKLSNK